MATVVSTCFALLILYLIGGLMWSSLSLAYQAIPETHSPRFTAFSGISATIVAFLGVGAAIFTFWFNALLARRAQRKQHTITILLETRLSAEFRETKEKRRIQYPEFKDIHFLDWKNDRNATRDWDGGTGDGSGRRESADALLTLLNHYEFLALGIELNDLDEDLLKRSIRGIMCSLVDDARDVISHVRESNPNTYEHLTKLYNDWRIDGSTDLDGNPNERSIACICND